MDKLRTITGFNADDLLNKSGLLTQHENIKSLDKDLLYEKSNELKRHELPDIDLKYARMVLDEAMKNYDFFEEKGGKRSVFIYQEKWIAPRLHNALRLTRHEASQADIWNYLALYFSDYIRHRWMNPEKDKHIAEYLFRYVTKDRHQLAKLWWMAELTRNGSTYHEDGGIVSADFIQQILGVEDSRFQLTNLAVLSMQEDIFGNGLYEANDNWNRGIFIAIRKKVAPQPITSKASVKLNIEKYKNWLKDKPAQRDCRFGNTLPSAPSDFSYSSKQIEEISDWIRDSIERVDGSIWNALRHSTEEILKELGPKMQAKDIYTEGLERGLFFARWQQEQIPFACAANTDKFEVTGQTVTLLK
tara:strand:- start:318 stop:1394 length:1077 start_codon:yes stop_codon:yes gene_type:complete